MKKVVIFGKNAFLAKGFSDIIEHQEFQLEWFSKGVNSKIDNVIHGCYSEILDNIYFQKEYDVLVNFAILKDQSIEENIKYIDHLLRFAKLKKISKFVHFSSVIVYPYGSSNIDEYSQIEDISITRKGHYAKLKIAVDNYILNEQSNYNFQISLVRSGYVFDQHNFPNFSKKLFGNFRLLLGNSSSVLPTIEKSKLHQGLIKLFLLEKMPLVCHFFTNHGTNRRDFTLSKYPKSRLFSLSAGILILMPKYIFYHYPSLSLFRNRVESLFVNSNFSSLLTMNKLNIKF